MPSVFLSLLFTWLLDTPCTPVPHSLIDPHLCFLHSLNLSLYKPSMLFFLMLQLCSAIRAYSCLFCEPVCLCCWLSFPCSDCLHVMPSISLFTAHKFELRPFNSTCSACRCLYLFSVLPPCCQHHLKHLITYWAVESTTTVIVNLGCLCFLLQLQQSVELQRGSIILFSVAKVIFLIQKSHLLRFVPVSNERTQINSGYLMYNIVLQWCYWWAKQQTLASWLRKTNHSWDKTAALVKVDARQVEDERCRCFDKQHLFNFYLVEHVHVQPSNSAVAKDPSNNIAINWKSLIR